LGLPVLREVRKDDAQCFVLMSFLEQIALTVTVVARLDVKVVMNIPAVFEVAFCTFRDRTAHAVHSSEMSRPFPVTMLQFSRWRRLR
jgi:hypothetical protein